MKKNASVITPSNIGATPLFAAADQGHAAIACLLLSTEEGQLTLNTGYTPLCQAVLRKHTTVLKVLVSFDNIDVNKPNANGTTPIYVASENGNSVILRLLIGPNASINIPIDEHPTPLFIAAQNGHADIVNILLEKREGKNQLNVVLTESGASPLVQALNFFYFIFILQSSMQHFATGDNLGYLTDTHVPGTKGHTG